MNTISSINKVLFITLSNIGDVVLTLPVLDYLRYKFPAAKITVLVGPRATEIFQSPYIQRVIVYDKYAKLKDKIKLFNELKKERFDLVVDLRNTLFGVLLPVRLKTSPLAFIPKEIRHMRQRHLYKLEGLIPDCQRLLKIIPEKSLYIKAEDEKYINELLKENNITDKDKIIVISCGARSHIKRWEKEKFIELIRALMKEFLAKIILVGDKDDILITEYIAKNSPVEVLDLAGKTTLTQLAALLKKITLLITNDSAVLHLGSYLNIPVVAIFGPTNEEKYGPWSEINAVVKKEILCRPCEKAQCRFANLDCLKLIKVEDVLRQVRKVLDSYNQAPNSKQILISKSKIPNPYKRILIVRTDRIGDVLLSTPVIKAMRDAYPEAYIAMMVSPYTKEILEGNPYLDEVIVYDKETTHKGWFSSIRFTQQLKKKGFNLAIILHPTNRVHLISFFARIKRRIGYDRKLSFLLTDRIRHTKQLGERHELEYNLDLVRYLGIEPKDKCLFMPIKSESENWIEALLKKESINKTDKLLAIHPGASCPSKIWPSERFARVCDRLIEKYNFKVLIIAAGKDIEIADKVIKNMHHPVINLAGMTSISQLASLLKRCHLFISNDSGPVHIASAVGTPVISIFGRSQKGLSPLRWGPLGKRNKILHKEIGCLECLAHNCKKDFLCLKAISVEDVLDCVDQIMKS
ncbi:MAG: lipopolysaccharide heptosyltransferase II [Candidatus Omnitrophica bacterium]|nr:lipopolysaccharide heptosyltransferase II [Candidatus Omnitrophota bacterium]